MEQQLEVPSQVGMAACLMMHCMYICEQMHYQLNAFSAMIAGNHFLMIEPNSLQYIL